MSTPEPPAEENSRPWLQGAALSSFGVIIGIASLILFCHALGLNLRDQGWESGSDSWNTNRGEVITSFIGFGLGTIIFWLGFHQTTRAR